MIHDLSRCKLPTHIKNHESRITNGLGERNRCQQLAENLVRVDLFGLCSDASDHAMASDVDEHLFDVARKNVASAVAEKRRGPGDRQYMLAGTRRDAEDQQLPERRAVDVFGAACGASEPHDVLADAVVDIHFVADEITDERHITRCQVASQAYAIRADSKHVDLFGLLWIA